MKHPYAEDVFNAAFMALDLASLFPWHVVSYFKKLCMYHFHSTKQIGKTFGLRILDSYDTKIAKICNLWTFWPVIQLICHSEEA